MNCTQNTPGGLAGRHHRRKRFAEGQMYAVHRPDGNPALVRYKGVYTQKGRTPNPVHVFTDPVSLKVAVAVSTHKPRGVVV
jgi:hypothetical protein